MEPFSPQKRRNRSYVSELLYSRVAPGSFFLLVVVAKLFSLAEVDWAGSACQVGTEVVYRVAGIAFMCLVVFTYVIREGARAKERSLGARVVALAAAFMMTSVVALASPEQGPARLAVGEVMAAAGLVITIIALLTLRTSFSILPEARHLVSGGLYRFMRHPMYSGEFLTSAGLVLPAADWWAFPVFAAFCVLQTVRARYEERILSATFPDYAAYASGVPRFVPRLSAVLRLRRGWRPAASAVRRSAYTTYTHPTP